MFVDQRYAADDSAVDVHRTAVNPAVSPLDKRTGSFDTPQPQRSPSSVRQKRPPPPAQPAIKPSTALQTGDMDRSRERSAHTQQSAQLQSHLYAQKNANANASFPIQTTRRDQLGGQVKPTTYSGSSPSQQGAYSFQPTVTSTSHQSGSSDNNAVDNDVQSGSHQQQSAQSGYQQPVLSKVVQHGRSLSNQQVPPAGHFQQAGHVQAQQTGVGNPPPPRWQGPPSQSQPQAHRPIRPAGEAPPPPPSSFAYTYQQRSDIEMENTDGQQPAPLSGQDGAGNCAHMANTSFNAGSPNAPVSDHGDFVDSSGRNIANRCVPTAPVRHPSQNDSLSKTNVGDGIASPNGPPWTPHSQTSPGGQSAASVFSAGNTNLNMTGHGQGTLSNWPSRSTGDMQQTSTYSSPSPQLDRIRGAAPSPMRGPALAPPTPARTYAQQQYKPS